MSKQKYEVLLFDLDDTLFNHTYCYKKAVKDIVNSYEELNHIDDEQFFISFQKNNHTLWKEFQSKELSFHEFTLKRLKMTLNHFSVNISLEKIRRINESYHENYLRNIEPDSDMHNLLKQLKNTYQLGIVTNGTSYNAYKKVRRLGLVDCFNDEHIIISEEAGHSKPHPPIFYHVLELFKINPEKTLFIGDNYYTDICGAHSVGMDTLWVNHFNLDPPMDYVPTYDVKNIFHLKRVIKTV
ncbi:HAD family hydrolase [Mangrovibacillus sp. Mu-81]|jgi:2-haloalkanoic acid dehalogenase type II|uniref:HAD family hydrolase n=1 Tax=Mangrovibacillus sp. Mu-81 TaxID=3121478 RepID=UPI002FE476F0